MLTLLTRLRTLFPALIVVCLVAGCASAPRTSADDQTVHKVAVLSLLDEQTPVSRVGLTVFNNARESIDQRGTLNAFANEVLEKRLHAARPNWTVVQADADAKGLAKKNEGPAWTSFTGRISGDLQQIAQHSGADLMFVAIDTTLENSLGRGVGVWMRTISLSSVTNAHLHTHVLLVLVDRDGKELARYSAADGDKTVDAKSLGLSYDLSTLQQPNVKERVSEALHQQLAQGLTQAARGMGY
jgi:hypothetical protein